VVSGSGKEKRRLEEDQGGRGLETDQSAIEQQELCD
jgi:hypothetical protein